jgi:hypothetical protein
MRNLFKKIKLFVNYSYRQDLENRFLSDSIDLADLERRQQQIMRGQAPFQKTYCKY